MSLIKAISLLLTSKKATAGIIKGVTATLGKSKTKAYELKTAVARGASKGYTEAMKSLHKK